jgi:hypothetical protein
MKMFDRFNKKQVLRENFELLFSVAEKFRSIHTKYQLTEKHEANIIANKEEAKKLVKLIKMETKVLASLV